MRDKVLVCVYTVLLLVNIATLLKALITVNVFLIVFEVVMVAWTAYMADKHWEASHDE